jgi:hypothetical protein
MRGSESKSPIRAGHDYVRTNKINEVAATAIARQKFESVVPVIIAEGNDTDGLYFYSRDDEACLRLISIE